jgi:hypothetical protein
LVFPRTACWVNARCKPGVVTANTRVAILPSEQAFEVGKAVCISQKGGRKPTGTVREQSRRMTLLGSRPSPSPSSAGVVAARHEQTRRWSSPIRVVGLALFTALLASPTGCATEEADELTPAEARAAAQDEDGETSAGDDVGQSSEELRSAVSCTKKKATAYRSGSAFPITLITVGGKPVSIATGHAFLKMQKAANDAGVYLAINSGFRSMAEQQYLYNCYLSGKCNNGNLAAHPGYSNHQSGSALDLTTSTWLANNAGKFGFVRTVPSENWHYEFTGKDPGGVCSEGKKDNNDLRFTAPLDEGVYHNDGLTFKTTDKSGKAKKVIYRVGNTKIGSSDKRGDGFAISYTFASLGNRRVTATSYDKNGKEVDDAAIDVEITPKSKPNEPDGDTSGKCYARCCDGSLTKDLGAADGDACYQDAQKACDSKGHVKRIEQGGEEVWARADTCWALCKNRENYVSLSGVTKNCTDQSRDFCEEGDRGGLKDAMWSACNPN